MQHTFVAFGMHAKVNDVKFLPVKIVVFISVMKTFDHSGTQVILLLFVFSTASPEPSTDLFSRFLFFVISIDRIAHHQMLFV
jgi:hypothetical protein